MDLECSIIALFCCEYTLTLWYVIWGRLAEALASVCNRGEREHVRMYVHLIQCV
jgi:hypothetical protein